MLAKTLVNAILRHLHQHAQRWPQTNGEEPWPGISEYEAVRFIDLALTGLGYHVTPEWKPRKKRIDLLASPPQPSPDDPALVIEGKVIWDGWDGRLNVKRFDDSGEITKDFTHLPELEEPSRRGLVVWIAFTGDELPRKAEGAGTYRLADLLDLVPERFGWRVAAQGSLNLAGTQLSYEDYPWVRAYVWERTGSAAEAGA